MIFGKQRIAKNILRILDAVLACVAITIAFYLRQDVLADGSLGITSLPSIGGLVPYLIFWPPLLALSPLLLTSLKFYDQHLKDRIQITVNLAFQASIILFLALVCFQFFLNIQMSRLVLVFFVPIYAGLLIGRTHLYGLWIKREYSRGHNLKNLLVAWDGAEKTDWTTRIENDRESGLKLIREVNLGTTPLSEFIQILHDQPIEVVIFDAKKSSFEKISAAIRACEDEGIQSWLTVDFLEMRIARAAFHQFNQRPILVFSCTSDASWQLMLKEIMDRTGALLAIILLSPLFAAIYLMVKYSSPGKAIFSQQRSGRYGRPFTMFKFRSMVTDAEQLKQDLAHLNEMSGPVFKATSDPRITPVGSWLRKTSLDELPQLFNVLKGEMSLVGPRPLPLYETLAITENTHRRRLSMKPGLTCLWQISGRNEVKNFSDWVRLDLKYIDEWSLRLDLVILFKTLPTVLFRRGAS